MGLKGGGLRERLTTSTDLVPVKGAVELAHRELDMTNTGDAEWANAMIGASRHSSADAWTNYRRIGEVRYALARSQRIAGYAKLRGVRSTAGGTETKKADAGVVADEVAMITSRFGGVRGLIERYYLLRMVTGEGYLIQVRDTPQSEPDGYWFCSPSELAYGNTTDDLTAPINWTTAKKMTSTGGSSVYERSILRKDFIGRVWSPDGEFVDMCDAPMQGVNFLCDQLWTLTESIMGRLRSRLAMNGLLLVPSEMNDAAISSNVKPGTYSNNKVLNYLIHVMTTNLTMHADAKGSMPIAASGPAEVLDKLRWVIAEFQVQETDLKLRAELINRILDGLYQSRQQTQGNQGASHFQAWTNGDEERRVTVQPDLDSFCHAVTRLILWRRLQERGWTPGRIRPWRVAYDLSDAQVRSNQGEDARQAWDRGVVNGSFLRTISGAGETDAMDPLEYARFVGLKSGNPYLACYGLPGLEAIDWTIVAGFGSRTGPDPESLGDDEQAGPGSGDPGSPDDDESDTPKSERPG